MNYFKPQLVGETGNKQFVLYNGEKTKQCYDVASFENDSGVYPILNENNEVVEYMDILGNFSKTKKKFAMYFYIYSISVKDTPFLTSQYMKLMFSGLVDFPSKYMVDEKIKQIIIKEEKRRFKYALKNGLFDSLFEALRYKLYINNIMKSKIHKAENYKNSQDNVLNEELNDEQ